MQVELETKKCLYCGERSTVKMTMDQYNRIGSDPIQDIFPEKPREERELIISGTHPKCWNDLFGKFEDE